MPNRLPIANLFACSSYFNALVCQVTAWLQRISISILISPSYTVEHPKHPNNIIPLNVPIVLRAADLHMARAVAIHYSLLLISSSPLEGLCRLLEQCGFHGKSAERRSFTAVSRTVYRQKMLRSVLNVNNLSQ